MKFCSKTWSAMFLLTSTLILTAKTKESNETIDAHNLTDVNQDFLDNNNNNNINRHNLTYAQTSLLLKNKSFSSVSTPLKENESGFKTVNDTHFVAGGLEKQIINNEEISTQATRLSEDIKTDGNHSIQAGFGNGIDNSGSIETIEISTNNPRATRLREDTETYGNQSAQVGFGNNADDGISRNIETGGYRGNSKFKINDKIDNDFVTQKILRLPETNQTDRQNPTNELIEPNTLGLKLNHENTKKSSNIEQRTIDDAVEYGLRSMQELVDVKEPLLYQLGLFLKNNHPGSKVATFGAPNQRGLELSKFGYASLEATLKIAESMPHSVSRESAGLPESLQSRLILNECPIRGEPRCAPASRKYRTIDGTCNNPENPWRGVAMLPMVRFLAPVYEDGIQRPRLSVFGNKLPLVRDLSVHIHRDKNKEIQSVTLMFTQWGQFLDHDITNTVKSRGFNGTIPQCCDGDGRGFLPPELTHQSCLPIEIPQTDWFLSRFGIRCMEFVRSAPSTRINCDLGWREQINQVTPFIDASQIYGSDMDTSDLTRTFRHGKLIYGRPHNQGPLQPPDPPGGELCRAGALTTDCLQSGDGRVGETPGLTALHTVFVRYHNKIATVLSKVNPHWSDERTFQETRKILSAVMQHITYNEYLPIVVGPEVMTLFGLTLLKNGYYNKYDAKVNPAIANGFATAAFRFGHSMVQNSLVRTDNKHRPLFNNVTLHEELENIENIWSFGSIDRTVLGFCNQPSQRRDEFIADELTNHLFQTPGTFFGMDLAAINIQRGRDHGIAPYTAWREPCGLTPIKNWLELEGIMPRQSVQKFQSIYLHVDDIDLYSGGLAEKPLRGGVVGPTFACIIAQQFLNLRNGDRFWYENGGFESSFTPAQLQQLRRVSLAQILCQTLDEIETLQPFVFLSSDNFRNIRISCDSATINSFDLSPWIERANFNNVENNIDDQDIDRLSRSTNCKNRKKQRRKMQINANLVTQRLSKSTTTTANKQKVTPTQSPFRITVTNLTTNKVPIQNKYGGNSIKSRPQYYQISDSDHSDVTYLFGIVPDGITPSSTQTQKPLEVNIKIQYYPPTTTKKPSQKKKKPNSTTRQPSTSNYYDTDSVVITKRPTTTKRPEYNYPIYLQSPPNSYGTFESTVTTRPHTALNQRPTYDNDDNYYRPSFYPDRPTNYEYNYRPNLQQNSMYDSDVIYESEPFSTSKKPYIYRPNSNHYVYTDLYTSSRPLNNDVTKRPSSYYDDTNKRPSSYSYSTKKPSSYYDVTKRPSSYYDVTNRPSAYDDITKRPSYYDDTVYTYNSRPVTIVQLPSYNRVEDVYSQYFNSQKNRGDTDDNGQIDYNFEKEHNDRLEQMNKIKTQLNVPTDSGDINDKLDFKSRVVYKQPTSNTNDNNDRFVKISSVKTTHNIDKLTREREGDLELDNDGQNTVRVIDIDVAPSEFGNNQWVVFNETEEPSTLLQVPELEQFINVDFSKEIPKPIVGYSTKHAIRQLNNNKDGTTDKGL